jgi:hypothetical protein
MRYFHLSGGNGYCGCDWDEYIAVTEEDLESDPFYVESCADNFAYEYAESYEYVVTGWDEDWECDEDREDYYDSISNYTNWEEITEEEYLENIR